MSEAQELNIIDKAKNFGTAMTNWAIADEFSKVTDEQHEYRKSICTACPHWDSEAFLGTGKCNKCGCSGLKLYIPSSRCPLDPPKWSIIYSDHTSSNSQ